MPPAIRLGDPFFHGGSIAGVIEILSAITNVYAEGVHVAMLLSSGFCEFHERFVFIITASQDVVTGPGELGLARAGDLMDCGAVLEATQFSVLVNGP